MLTNLKEVLDIAKDHDGENTYHDLSTDYKSINVDGFELKPYEVSITKGSLVFFCDRGIIDMVIDYYGNKPVVSIYSWETDNDL